jgi:hypothetical protein
MDEQSRKQGSRKVGSLISQTVATQRIVDGTESEYPQNPRHSGTITPSIKHSPESGMPHGEHGSNMPTSSRHATEIVATASLGTLHRDPGALLPRRVTSCLASTWEGNNTGYGWDGYVSAYELTAPVPPADLAVAIEIAEAALHPASPQRVLAELTRVRSLTVSRDQSTNDLELIAAAYTDELKKYPLDAVVEVLRDWPRSHRFWPAMAELLDPLDRLVAPRHALREALRRGYREPEVSPDWIPPPSEEDKAAVIDLLAKHGYAVDHNGRVRPPEAVPMTAEEKKRVADETAAFRLPDKNDPRVQARLREMGVGDGASDAAA